MGQAVEPVSVLTVEDVTAMGVLVYQMVQSAAHTEELSPQL
jgi:hypothetical protein